MKVAYKTLWMNPMYSLARSLPVRPSTPVFIPQAPLSSRPCWHRPQRGYVPSPAPRASGAWRAARQSRRGWPCRCAWPGPGDAWPSGRVVQLRRSSLPSSTATHLLDAPPRARAEALGVTIGWGLHLGRAEKVLERKLVVAAHARQQPSGLFCSHNRLTP